MRSLSAHLREAGGHGHLPFHPGCGACQTERLAGSLPDDALVPPRARASIAAALMAVSTLPTAPAVAQEADIEQDGSGPGGGSQGSEPAFDDGREDLEPPLLEDGPELEESQEEMAPPVETIRELPEGAENPQPQSAPPVTPPPPPPAGGGPEGASDSPGEGESAPQEPPAKDGTEGADANPRPPRDTPPATLGPRGREKPGGPSPSRGAQRALERITSPSPPAPLAAPEPQGGGGRLPLPATAGAPASPSERPDAGGGARADRVHVVQPGESLWSIANTDLGGRASPAQIAREVNRIWELNSGAIATGDPDLLMVGTKLKLP